MFMRSLALALVTAGPVAAAPVTVAALGDSLTQGYGLAQDDGLVPRLQAWLRGHGADVTLINAGVSGDTTAGGLSRVRWTLTPEVDGVIVALGGNDLLRGIDPAVIRANIAGILDAAKETHVKAMLIGISAPGNYGADYSRDFDAIYPDLGAQYAVPVVPSMFGAIVSSADPSALMQPDQIHPNAAGVEAIVAAIGPPVLDFVAGMGACEAPCAIAD